MSQSLRYSSNVWVWFCCASEETFSIVMRNKKQYLETTRTFVSSENIARSRLDAASVHKGLECIRIGEQSEIFL